MPLTIADMPLLKQAVRDVLNEGTAEGFLGWAQMMKDPAGMMDLLRKLSKLPPGQMAEVEAIAKAVLDEMARRVAQ